ncbi:hypothetical protein OBK01_11845 [Empedobacter falsenii]
MKKLNILKSMLLLFSMTIGTNALAQKIRPTSSSSTAGYLGGPTINEAERAKAYDTDVNTYTEVKTSQFSLFVSYSPNLHLNYPTAVPANKDFYMKVNVSDGQILDKIAGGYIGGFLNNVVSGLLGGIPENYFKFKNGNNDIFTGTTHNYNRADLNKMRLLRDGFGNSYFKFSLGQSFDQVSVRAELGGLITTPARWIHVYDTYYYDNPESCLEFLTYSEVADDLLTLLGNNTGINNPHHAIDSDLTTFSSFGNQSLLNLGLGVSMEQFFQLPKLTDDKLVRIKMQMPSSLLDVEVASGIEINFYNGTTKLSSQTVDASVVNADLLGLINAGNNVPFSFLATPPTDANGAILAFDKVSVSVKKPVSLGVLDVIGDLRIYDVAFVDTKPETVKVCSREFINNNIRERKFDLTQIIPDFNVNTAYVVVDREQNEIPFTTPQEKEANKWQPLGTYYIKGINTTGHCPNEYSSFAVVQDPQFKITGKSAISVPLDANNDGTPDASVLFDSALYSSDLPSNQGVQIFDELTNTEVTGQTIQFNKIGSYNYYAISKNNTNDSNVTCDIVKRITVYVYDKEECDYRYVQRIARNKDTGFVLTGGTSDSEKAADDDLSTHGTIFNLLNLAGIGTAWIDLTFDNVATDPIPAGTPITIKLGQEYSLLQLIGGTTIQTLDQNGQIVGDLISINEVDLLNVLVGDNVFEFTYVPKVDGNEIPYGGVRIINGGLLGVATSAKVYGAYVDERIPISQAGVCDSNIAIEGAEIQGDLDAHLLLNTSTQDVLYGVEDAGLGVATALSGVVYPYLAADAIEDTSNANNPLNGSPDFSTAAIFNTSVGALNRQTLTVKFKEIARPGDKVRITMNAEGAPILDLNVLSNFSIQRYLGDQPIGDPVTNNDFSLIKLDLLKLIADQSQNKYAVILDGIGASFDRVELRMDNVVSANLLGTRTYVYDVSVIPNFEFDEDKTVFCTSAPFRVEKLDPCSGYELSFAYATLSNTVDPITGEYDILGWNDIANSTLPEIDVNDPRYDEEFHQYQLRNLYSEYSAVDNLYLKVVTKRQGCTYGDTQYFKIKIKNCSTISNPMIRTRLYK